MLSLKNKIGSLLMACCVLSVSADLAAQGQDSTTAERDIMILEQLLPGHFINSNQAYFDQRLKVEESQRHGMKSWLIEPIEEPKFGAVAFSLEQKSDGDSEPVYAVISFVVDDVENAVRMQTYQLSAPYKARKTKFKHANYLEGCDLLWTQQAGQFRGRASQQECDTETTTARDILFSPEALWVSYTPAVGAAPADHYAMDRARSFNCYADLPGVGGGRDIPFKRYEVKDIHDLGGEKWFTTDEGQEIGINLFRVMWTFNNYEGVFTRPSFVAYIKTKENEEAKAKEISYAWTEPTAQRIGINLKWMLVNCYMLSNEDVLPFFKLDEPKL